MKRPTGPRLAAFLALGCALIACTGGGGSPGGAGGSAGTGTAGAGGSAITGAAGGTGGTADTTARGGTGGGGTGGAAAGTGGATAPSDVWVGPAGADSNPGTEAMPFRTLTAAHARAMPGSTIWILPGTNQLTATNVLSKNGTAAAPIRIQPAAGAARPVLDFSGQAIADSARGIDVRGDYWVIRGLELRNAGDNCVAVSGSHNLFQDLVIHGCADTGLQITASSAQASDNTRAAYNEVINCDSYENLDQANNGENADGFAAKLRIGPGNVFRGCRAWNNADDGWDLFASDDVVTIDGCWAFLNGRTVTGTNSAGDGNGFKLGGAPNGEGQGGAVHLVTGSYAFDNRACGFVRNNNPEVPKLTSCGADGNATDYCSVSSSPAVSITMTGAQGKAAVRTADGSLPAIR